MTTRRAFLTAEWRWLVMLNYEIDPQILRPLAPRGTELDSFDGVTFVSVVGFLFLHTRVGGMAIPFHRDFEEVNLRFYVRRKNGEQWRRGVVFVRELVPRALIAWVARTVYGEPYLALPMRHEVCHPGSRPSCRCAWKRTGRWESLAAEATGLPAIPDEGSHESFITEHYWGYTGRRHSTNEYEVEHPRWQVWRARNATFDADVGSLYGAAFVEPLAAGPKSSFIAEGSPVTVRTKTTL
jgi:uncharacterized protein YqjF (DUF2071 family)